MPDGAGCWANHYPPGSMASSEAVRIQRSLPGEPPPGKAAEYIPELEMPVNPGAARVVVKFETT